MSPDTKNKLHTCKYLFVRTKHTGPSPRIKSCFINFQLVELLALHMAICGTVKWLVSEWFRIQDGANIFCNLYGVFITIKMQWPGLPMIVIEISIVIGLYLRTHTLILSQHICITTLDFFYDKTLKLKLWNFAVIKIKTLQK